MNAAQEAAARYGAVAIGLAIGTAARYGLALGDGKRLTWRGILADLLLLGILGLLAVIASDWAGLTGNAKVLAGALAAVSSDRLVRLVRDRFEKAATDRLDTMVAPVSADRADPKI